MRRRTGVGLLVALLGLGVCCAGSADGSTDGPMRVEASSGVAESVAAPSIQPWTVTFGDLPLCTSAGRPVTVEAVTYRWRVRPLEAHAAVHVEHVGRGNPDLMGSTRLDLHQLGTGRHRLAGHLEPARGAVVDAACGRHPAGYDELLLSMRVGPAGGWLTSATVHYVDAEHRRYSAVVDWQMIGCGSAVETTSAQAADFCDPPMTERAGKS